MPLSFFISALADFPDLYVCPNRFGDEPSMFQRGEYCILAYSIDKPLEKKASNRLKRSLEESLKLLGAEQDLMKTIQLPSSFIPRLGRRRVEGRTVPDLSGNVVNMGAGTAFTPRLG